MISMSFTMPIAVMIESSEKTRSITTSCATTRANDCAATFCRLSLAMLDFGVDFMRRFRDQEHAAADQDDVAPGNADAEDRKQRIGQFHQPSQAEQHGDAENEGERKPDLSRPAALLRASSAIPEWR